MQCIPSHFFPLSTLFLSLSLFGVCVCPHTSFSLSVNSQQSTSRLILRRNRPLYWRFEFPPSTFCFEAHPGSLGHLKFSLHRQLSVTSTFPAIAPPSSLLFRPPSPYRPLSPLVPLFPSPRHSLLSPPPPTRLGQLLTSRQFHDVMNQSS